MDAKLRKRLPLFCAECANKTKVYIDESDQLDRTLLLVAQLCSGVRNGSEMPKDVLRSIGRWLKDYLRERNLVEWYFFDRPLSVPLHDPHYKAQLNEIRATIDSLRDYKRG